MPEVQIKLPDGSVRQVPAGTTPAELLDTTDAVAALVDAEPWDLRRGLDRDATLIALPAASEQGRVVVRHSTAHVLAQAVTDLYPEARYAIGPPTEDGFYYDFDVPAHLCRGPHVPSTAAIPAFKLLRAAGAYWRGDESRQQLQRIYGTAWESEEALADHMHRLEEAERRDHRRLGLELDLFHFPPEIGSGLPVFHPKGGLVRKLMEDYSRAEHEAAGYSFVWTPHLTKDLPVAGTVVPGAAAAVVRVRHCLSLRAVWRDPWACPGAGYHPGRCPHLLQPRAAHRRAGQLA